MYVFETHIQTKSLIYFKELNMVKVDPYLILSQDSENTLPDQ